MNKLFSPANAAAPAHRAGAGYITYIIFLLLSLITPHISFAANNSDAERYVTLTKEIRCIVCQNQNLADSTAPIADDLRQKIYAMILEKKSDEEIKDYLVKRYGEFILLRPRFNQSTVVLWLFPLAGLVFILWYVLRLKPEATF